MRAMFRLTGKPVADILLIFLWWPIAASILMVVGLFGLISHANRRVDEADRHAAEAGSGMSMEEGEELARARAAHEHTERLAATDADRRQAVDVCTKRLSSDGLIVHEKLDQLADLTLAVGAAKTRGELAAIAGLPLATFGPLKAAPEPIVLQLKRRGPLAAVAFGVLLMIVGGAVQQFGIAFLGCLSIVAAVALWTWRRARRSRVWKTVGLGFLAWTITVSIAAVVAPPETTPTGPKVASWSEWCATYSNADGSLNVGPPDIRPAVIAAERLPVVADTTAASEVGYAVASLGSDASYYTYSNSYYQRSAAEHLTHAAAVICKPWARSGSPSNAPRVASMTTTPPNSAQSIHNAQSSAEVQPTPAQAGAPPAPARTQLGVTPGAFCKKADEGDYGWSGDGDLYRCTTSGAGSDQPKWMPV